MFPVLILHSYFDFVGSNGVLQVVFSHFTDAKGGEYYIRSAFREGYIRLDSTLWNSQDINDNIKLAVWCR